MKEKNRVLILAPHTDDGELGCGGAMARFIEEGKEVFSAAFSICSRSLPAGLPPDTLAKESREAFNILGAPDENLTLFDYDVRRFKEFRQNILEDLITLRNKINPDIVFVPSPSDIHQDHQVISEEGLRAFKNRCVLGYELPWNTTSFDGQSFVTLEKSHVEKKIQAASAYVSQKHRNYMNPEFIRSQAIVRGVQMNVAYAEAFETLRWVV
jgi:N-acetylglucosamine malate deacetylase 1